MAHDYETAGFTRSVENGVEVLCVKPRLFGGLKEKATITYQIRDRKLLRISDGLLTDSLNDLYISRIESIRLVTNPVRHTLDYADLVFIGESGNEHKWSSVPKAHAVKDFIQSIVATPEATKPKDEPSRPAESAAARAQKKEAELRRAVTGHVIGLILGPLGAFGAFIAVAQGIESRPILAVAAVLFVGIVIWIVKEVRHDLRQARDRLRRFLAAEAQFAPIVFDRRVLVLPPLLSLIENTLQSLHLRSKRFPTLAAKAGDWIERGQPLFSFHLRPSANMSTRIITIKSPVSGLLLGPTDIPGSSTTWPLLLLPENEPPPLPVEEIYGELSDYCFRCHTDGLFENTGSTYEEEYVRSECEKQKSEPYGVWDVESVHLRGPVPVSYLLLVEDFSRKHPALEQSLRNVLPRSSAGERVDAWDRIFNNPDNGRRSRGEHETTEDTVHQEPSDYGKKSRDDESARQTGHAQLKEALEAFALDAVPATIEGLDTRYWRVRQSTPENLWPDLKRYYEILRATIG